MLQVVTRRGNRRTMVGMRRSRDPLANPEPLVRRVYAYVAYRIGDGPDAEDVTGETFERAVRYRSSYDPARASPATWLVGIARRVLADRAGTSPIVLTGEPPDQQAAGSEADQAVTRLDLREAMAQLSERDRDLLALRYGGDLRAREIAESMGAETHAVEVALSRALARLRRISGGSRARV
jgi:RNA polymerase sigma factor (sigma-70 family)